MRAARCFCAISLLRWVFTFTQPLGRLTSTVLPLILYGTIPPPSPCRPRCTPAQRSNLASLVPVRTLFRYWSLDGGRAGSDNINVTETSSTSYDSRLQEVPAGAAPQTSHATQGLESESNPTQCLTPIKCHPPTNCHPLGPFGSTSVSVDVSSSGLSRKSFEIFSGAGEGLAGGGLSLAWDRSNAMSCFFATARLPYTSSVLQPTGRSTWTSLPLTLNGIVTVNGNQKRKEQQRETHADDVSRHSANDERDQRGHLLFIFLQRRVLLLDGSSDLRLLGVSAVGCDHSERHTGVSEIVDRVSPLPWERKRGRLHALALLGSQDRHQRPRPKRLRSASVICAPVKLRTR